MFDTAGYVATEMLGCLSQYKGLPEWRHVHLSVYFW